MIIATCWTVDEVLAAFDTLEPASFVWPHDTPPVGNALCDPSTSLRLADAFRMLQYLAEPDRQLWWIEHHLKNKKPSPTWSSDYEATLIRWWLEIFDASKKKPGFVVDPGVTRQEPVPPPMSGIPAGFDFSEGGSV
jgi:hypothetical protein